MINVLAIITALVVAAWLLFSRRLAASSDWSATITPLASIMGSGFLVSAPLLAGVIGNYALVGMAALLSLAWLVGGAIRYNIRYFEPIENDGFGAPQSVALVSRVVLAGAYFISVSYYLQLLSAFSLTLVGVEDPRLANWIATGILVAIGLTGMWRGLDELEKVEKYAVSVNLGVIAALLVALLAWNIQLVLEGSWALAKLPATVDWEDARVLLGLLIVVQGFETSRYLGDAHPAEQRIRTMKLAQGLSAAIYLVFIALATVLFTEGLGSDVTAIIGMTAPVAVVLPFLLTLGAIGSQFSAAVADNVGAGGLVGDLSRGKLQPRVAYGLIMLITVSLTWASNVNEIIAYASRAFALFYMLQCVVAALMALRRGQWSRVAGFIVISFLCMLVFLFGIPSE